MAALATTAGCRDTSPTELRTPPTAPSKVISDGAHGGGNDDVFFLPPMVSNPSSMPGYGNAFQPGLPVEIKVVCLVAVLGSPCTASDFQPATVKMSLTDQHYIVNWDTKAPGVDAGDVYRIEIWIGSTRVAFADVALLSNGPKNISTQDNIPLADGRTLPIKVRIEKGWNCKNNNSCASQVVTNTPENQPTIVMTGDGRAAGAFSGNWIPYCGSVPTPGCVPQGTQVVVTIEDKTDELNTAPPGGVARTCSLKDENGNPKTHMLASENGRCVKFTTDPEFKFAHFVDVAVCVETDDVTQQLVKYDDDETPRFLENVSFYVNGVPFTVLCEQNEGRSASASPSSNGVVSYALGALARAGRALGRLVTPKSAYAIHLGVGGRIEEGPDGEFSYVSPGRAMTMSSFAGDGQSAVINTAVATPPQARITTVHRQFNPVGGQSVRCEIVSGGGNFGAAGLTSLDVPTLEGGVASCPWVLGATAGAQAMRMVALGIDHGVITVENDEGPQEQTLNGIVSFTATATLPPAFGSIQGTVRNTAGSPVQSASVSATNDATGQAFTAFTNAAGSYNIGSLRAGSYTVIAQKIDFVDDTQSEVGVTSNPVTVDLSLQPLPPRSGTVLFAVNSSDDGLSFLDPATGISTFMNRLSPNVNLMVTPTAMAARPSDGALFVWNNSDEGASAGAYLVRVNACTGRGTRINVDALNVNIHALAFSPTGTLYGLQSFPSNTLMIINQTTGSLTPVGPLQFQDGPAFSPSGADFGPDGSLYAASRAGQLVTVDVSTGGLTLVGVMAPNQSDVQSIAFAPSGQLIGAAGGQLFDISITDATVTNFRNASRAPQGMDFAPAPSCSLSP